MARIKRVLFSAVALGGVAAAIGIIRKVFSKVEIRHPGVYIEETPTGAQPIEGVGTSTAEFVGTRPRKARTRRRTMRSKS